MVSVPNGLKSLCLKEQWATAGARRLGLAMLLTVWISLPTPGLDAQPPQVEPRITVASGWHPWYEIKSDPDESKNLIICGSRWDAARNAFYGFVYASANGGETWRTALEDRETDWVSEQSCAFGRNHTAYFVSEASKVIDGENHHDRGETRVFVSMDGGQHWRQTSSTAWSDYSTSAVSPTTGNLVTFYNDPGTYDPGRNRGSSVGALVFSPDGKRISGPFVDPAMKEINYQGVFPKNAVGLKDGSVVALYVAPRKSPAGIKYDLGIVRVELSPSPSATFSVIAWTTKCLTLDGSSLTFDEESNQLSAVYAREDGESCWLDLAISKDGGKSWARKLLSNGPKESTLGISHVSLAQGPGGILGLVWKDPERWLFATVKDGVLSGSPLELVRRPSTARVLNDSLMTIIGQSKGPQLEQSGLLPTAQVNVRAMPGVVWRSSALVRTVDRFLVVLPTVSADGEGLKSLVVSAPKEGNRHSIPSEAAGPPYEEVTGKIALLYGRAQCFDNAAGTLSIHLRIANRGDRPLRLPIRIEAEAVGSSAGKVIILNADNNLSGPGAIWDVSSSVTGNRLLPGTATYNSFPLLFQIKLAPGTIPTEHLLNLRVRVFAAKDSPSQLARPHRQR